MKAKSVTYAAAGVEDQTEKRLPSSYLTLGERIGHAINDIGLDASVRATGKSARQLARYVAQDAEPPLSVITGLAEISNFNIAWLATGQPPIRKRREYEEELPQLDLDAVRVPHLDIRASAGGGATGETGDAVDYIKFPRSFLRSKGLNIEALRIVTVVGDSMEPTLSSGDLLLVDTIVKRIRSEALYVLVRDDEVYVKRAQKRINGSILIASDNDRYPPEELTEKDAEKLHIAGRVVWFGRSI